MSLQGCQRAWLGCFTVFALGMGCKTGSAEKSPHETAESCNAEASASTQLTHDETTKSVDASGKEVVHVGKPFEDVRAVPIAELLANPDAFTGKTVQIAGHVSAMCHHKRSWFAMVGSDQSGRYVRVLTAPTFLVPSGAIGKRARAQGTVEVVEINPAHAAHLATDHQLGKPEGTPTPNKRVILRATGADFS